MKYAFFLGALVAQLSLSLPVASARGDEILDFFNGAQDNRLLSIEDILSRVRETTDAAITEIELERERGKWIYEVEIRTPEGREIELTYDARSGDLLSRGRGRR
jgi:uncharacterized membrane protein YkoI